MASERHKTAGRLACAALLPALALAAAGQAQTQGSVQDYHLPPGTPAPTPTAAGPVDPENPVAAPARPAPPTINLPSPAVTQPAQPVATPTPRSESRPRAVPQPPPAPAPAATQPGPAAASIPTAAPTAEATIAPTIEPAPLPTATAPAEAAPAPAGEGLPWPWIAGGAAAILLAAGGLLLRRRRRAGAEAIADEEASAAPPAAAQPEPSAPAALRPVSSRPLSPASPAPRRAAAPPGPQPSTAERQPLEMRLEARHLSRAMVNATLAYRLTLTNHDSTALGPLRVAGDITSAHASLPAAELLAPNGDTLATIHEVPQLAPGASTVLSGELRLPLASILPIQSGSARVFVPLARFRVDAGNGTATTRVFVVGQASEQPGGALRPFPLDRGPGVDRWLDQHELELPA
jgi:hypothetical protein